MSHYYDPGLLMGQVLVREGLLTEEALQAAILQQVGYRALKWPGKPLGHHLIVTKAMTKASLEAALRRRDAQLSLTETPVLGRLAVRNGFLTEEEVSECLREQEAMRAEGGEAEPLGRIILMKKLMHDQRLQAIIDRQKALAEAVRKNLPVIDAAG